MKIIRIIPLLAIAALASCTNENDKRKLVLDNQVLSDCNTAIQNSIVTDHVPAPAGSRRYMYACVAAYESLVPFYPEYQSLAGQMHGLKSIAAPDTSKGYCLDLVALSAHNFVARKVVYNEESVTTYRDRKLAWYKEKLPRNLFKNSVEWGEKVGKHVAEWSKSDSFASYTGKDFYLVKEKEGYWQPTTPDFMDAILPNWCKLRTAVIPSCNAFSIPPPEPYSIDKNSRFYKNCMEVYNALPDSSPEKRRIALYWDDNPNTMEHIGHATISKLKISPAGHWLAIFAAIARGKKLSLIESAAGFAKASAALHDGFIACWESKFKYEYIRPETAIRRLIDSSWTPLIQTPAFPEYPSGHSTVSTAVATVIDNFMGDFKFTDSSEAEFGLGTRSFNNVTEAALEAGMSRIYGGIHFMDGNIYGRELGKKVGDYHVAHLKTRRDGKY